MKIVILDGYTENPGDLSWREMEKYGELIIYDRTPVNDEAIIQERIGDAEVVFTNKTPISSSIFDKAWNLKYIGVLATGYNIVDIPAAKKKGVIVSNIPTYGTTAVAQYTIALILEICHHIGYHAEEVKNGRWEKSLDWCFWDYPLIELSGKTLGIVGYGRIGQTTGIIARSLGMNVIAYDEYQHDEEGDTTPYVSFEELLKKADIISLHCPLTDSNVKIINQTTIGKMKDGVIIINSSRGGLIDEQHLADALNTGKIYAAAVDVVSNEPIRSNNPLLTAKNCMITPHIAWACKESRERLMNIAVNNLNAYVMGQPINVVS